MISKQKAKKPSQVKKSSVARKLSMAKTISRLQRKESEEEGGNQFATIQKLNLLKKQKSFLSNQAEIFEKRSKSLKEQVKDIEIKMRNQKALVRKSCRDLELEIDEEQVTPAARRSKPQRTFGQKAKKLFRLGY